MKLLAISIIALGLAACTSPHGAGAVEVGANDCYTCHQSELETAHPPGNTSNPDRSTDCASCHYSTSDWTAAGLHPDDKFRITRGHHSGIRCEDCHDASRGAAQRGENTICTFCHEHSQGNTDGHHDEVGNYHWDPNRPNFCLDCHPDGRAGD